MGIVEKSVGADAGKFGDLRLKINRNFWAKGMAKGFDLDSSNQPMLAS